MADGAQVAAGAHHRVGDAEGAEFLDRAVHGVALGDAAEIEADAGAFEAHGLRGGGEFEVAVIDARQDGGEFGVGREAVFFPDETPQLRERLDGDVEAAVGGGGDGHGGGEDAKQIWRHGDGVGGGGRVDALQFAVRAVEAHERVDAADFGEGGGDGVVHARALRAGWGDGADDDERAEQRLAAADEFRGGRVRRAGRGSARRRQQ